MTTAGEQVDVLIVGAGLSGIGAACQVRRAFPRRRVVVLESRGALGGTWDLFRYPGIRSDSDMYTLGYRFRPWLGEEAIASGSDILDYVRATAAEYEVEECVRYHHRVVAADWSSAESRWTVRVERTDSGETCTLTAGFLFCCSGYYRYDEGYTPEFAGAERFPGPVVHPQHWPEDLDVAGKRVAVIGSGATAVTLGPALTARGAHVTMVQRSPSYVISAPARDDLALRARKFLPAKAAYAVARAKNVAVATAIYQLSQRYPERMRARIRGWQQRWLPEGYDIDTHFTPRYGPWDQRLCLAPNGDFFRAIRKGELDIVTDRIASFTETGLAFESGAALDADIIVTATGLNLLAFGGIDLAVDGRPVSMADHLAYKALMLSGVPNFAFVIGYTNASWTLKADLVSEYVVRLLRHMDSRGYATCVPVRDPSVGKAPLFENFMPGYVLRAATLFPMQGDRAPWKLRMNYLRDLITLRHKRIEDGALRFERSGKTAGSAVSAR
ncbi:NAD(P)/FAD-dependent oxidoreductase [Nocardia puris]|uniref:flavin-containing monooxygenase n=1 Tax=Nocardia puris TaxID=208602 RepID=UPI0018934A92|nr:NAD(P)/FAD-dependent oxidoreductase [Nocardia puris]MBF6209824.1 NAD(P)/FAD-dependent oxidoreductase [Nocardia puris]MBF6366396.1 NAD(P)/FAD-dependent oxidoreductase [Nocardia puris]MBF6458265.1 NAD(P)/FAD-dependent oxidoreductase [Nocardia puris]